MISLATSNQKMASSWIAVSKTSREIQTPGWNPKDPRPKGSVLEKKVNSQSMRPLGGLIVYPAYDPYRPQQRAMFRAIHTKIPWILRANTIIEKLVAGNGYTTSIEPREDKEIKESLMTSFRKKPITIPYFERTGIAPAQMTPEKLKSWIDKMFDKLDLESIVFNAYDYDREQGRCAVGMFPETRDADGYYQLPKALRLIRPEFTRRPLLNRDSGALEAVEVVGLTTNGGRLDANRCIYFVNQFNLDLFADYYGRSLIDPLEDIGKTLLTIYAQDFRQAAEYTWHKPNIFKVTVPARDYKNPQKVLDDFLFRRNNSLGKDIAVTQTVELLPQAQNSGDISGVIGIQNECIDAVAGFYNIPPFMLAKGKEGRLGGNANQEEIDSFLENEIRPEQNILEMTIEKQGYDRVLAILFDIEPDEVDDPDKCPVRMRHHFNKPEISLTIDPAYYALLKEMVQDGVITKEGMLEKMGLSKYANTHDTEGEEKDPSVATWKKINPSWRKAWDNTNSVSMGWGASKAWGKSVKPSKGNIQVIVEQGWGKTKKSQKWNYEQ